jgi:hypothetical protein
MSKTSRKLKKVSTAPNPVTGHRMAKPVWRKVIGPYKGAKLFEIPLQIPHSNFCVVLRSKQKPRLENPIWSVLDIPLTQLPPTGCGLPLTDVTIDS